MKSFPLFLFLLSSTSLVDLRLHYGPKGHHQVWTCGSIFYQFFHPSILLIVKYIPFFSYLPPHQLILDFGLFSFCYSFLIAGPLSACLLKFLPRFDHYILEAGLEMKSFQTYLAHWRFLESWDNPKLGT